MRVLRAQATLALGVALLWSAPAHAGGTHIHPVSIRINGQQIFAEEYSSQEKVVVAPGSRVTFSFDATEYEYGASQYKYFVFAWAPGTTKVGNANRAAMAGWRFIYGLADDRVARPKLDDEMAPRHYSFVFTAPSQPGSYKLVQHQVSDFVDTKFAPGDELGQLVAAGPLTARLRGGMAAIRMLDDVATITVGSARPVVQPALYLRADGQNPAFAKIAGGLIDKPLKFSWRIGLEVRPDKGSTTLYRYRLEPSDDRFGPWVTDTSVRYHYLPRGVNDFQVQAKLTVAGRPVETRNASFQFTLQQPLVARPQTEATTEAPLVARVAQGATAKSILVGGTPQSPPEVNIAFDQLYGRSRALLIGMASFDDGSHFPSFVATRINTDVTTLAKVLNRNGFQVKQVFNNRLTRAEIMAALDGFISETQPGDRLIIYISSHGFADPQKPVDGYVAASDCSYTAPSANCIRLAELQNQAQRALTGNLARQVLIAVDSCFSGLGVVDKAGTSPNFARLAIRPGAFMMTAGMADQQAQIDPDFKMSTFTHFLAEGLEGAAAHYDRGGVITLSDLYTYVQYNVAKQTKSQQIPMLGRLTGDGEMLFKPSKTKGDQ